MSSAFLRGALGAAATLSAIVATIQSTPDAAAQTPLPRVDVTAPAPQVRRAPAGRTTPARNAGRARPAPQAAPTQAAPTQAAPAIPAETGPNALQQTTAGPVRGYQAETASSATKFDVPVNRIPQSIQAVPRKLIEDQGVVSQSEALRNVSGVQPPQILMGAQMYPSIRGFNGERYVDGLPNYYDMGARDLTVNVERLEVLKGPSSVLYGGGLPIGGIVNVVSKLPTMARFAEAGLTVGSNGHISPFFDINQPLNAQGTVLFRVTGQYEKTGTQIEGVERRSYTLNPTLTLTNNAGTSLTIQGHVSERRQPEYSGLPAVGTLDRSAFSIRRNLFVGDLGTLPDTRSQNMSLTARFDHAFNDTWSTFSAVRISRSKFHEPSQYVTGLVNGNTPIFGSIFQQVNGFLGEATTEVSANSNILAKFNIGPTQNKLLFGVDYNRVTDKGILNADAFITADLVDMTAPLFKPYVYPPSGFFSTFSDIDNVYTTTGATAQLHSTIFNRLHILAGARVVNVDIKSNERAPSAPNAFHSSDTKVLPRFGAVYDLLPGFSVFAAYSEGLRAVPFFSSLGVAPKPEGARNLEAGIKLNTSFGLSGTLAVFDLTRSNVVVAGPFGLGVQSGEQRSKGFEADLVWQPTQNLSFLASYAHIDAKVEKDTNAARIGAPLVGVPRNSGRLWANYTLTDGALKGLSFGAGLYAASKQSVMLGGPWRTQSYATIDGKIAYQYQNWTLSIVGKNLADRRYFIPYSFLDGHVAPAAGRTIYATLSAKL